MGRIRFLGAWLALWALIGSGTAVAEEAKADRMAELERLLKAQAEQLERIKTELDALKAQKARAAAAPAPSAAPVMPAAAAPVSVVSPQGQDPYASTLLQDRRLGSKAVATATRGSALGTTGLNVSGIRWGGYLTVEYIASSAKNSFFDLHRFILDGQAQVTDCIDIKAEIEIEHGGIGGGLDGDVKFEHMDVVFRLCDAFNPKVGALLIPMARFNQYHDDPYNDFTKRPWTARYLVPTGFGQPGFGAEGAFAAGNNTRLTYDFVVSSGYQDDFRASSGVRNARQSWRGDSNESKQVWGRVAYLTNNKTVDFLEAGVSGTWAKYDRNETNDLWGFALDLTARKGPLELHIEYIRMKYERNGNDPIDAVRGQDAFWAELGYHFFPSFMCDCNNCLINPTSHFTLAVRYQTMDLDDRRVGAHFNDDLTGYGIALNYRITEGAVFRIDHQWYDARRESDQRELAISFSSFF